MWLHAQPRLQAERAAQAGEMLGGLRPPELRPRGIEALANVELGRNAAPREYTGGITIDLTEREAIVLGAPIAGSSAERSGLQEGDILLGIGGIEVDRSTWRSVLGRITPGTRVQMRVRRFRRVIDVPFDMGVTDIFSYYFEENPGAGNREGAMRQSWLGYTGN